MTSLVGNVFGFKALRALRLEEIVKTYPANKLNLLNTKTEFSTKSEESNGALIVKAYTHPSFDTFRNTMLGLVILRRSIVLGSIFNAPAIFVIPKY
jgi:hypothetical protein